MKAMFHNSEMVSLIERFLDLCPRMNEGDPIGPALRDVCQDAKRVLFEIENRQDLGRSKSATGMSTLQLHIGSAASYLETDGNIDAALGHLAKAERLASEATDLIARIGTTGVERTDIIRLADEWPNRHI